MSETIIQGIEELVEWCQLYNLDFADSNLIKTSPYIFNIQNKDYLFITDRKVLFNDKFQIQLTPEEKGIARKYKDLLFNFGGKFYTFKYPYNDVPNLSLFKNIGKANQLPSTYLGIHGKFEIMNGVGEYAEFCSRAQHLNITSLGLCETHTLAGAIDFQKACIKAKIKPIFGLTLNIVSNDIDIEHLQNITLFAKNEAGWKNLVRINNHINVDNLGAGASVNKIYEYASDLICIINDKYRPEFHFKRYFKEVYFSIDTVWYRSPTREEEHIKTIAEFIDQEYEPINLNHSFYPNKQEFYLKKMLNKLGNNYYITSPNQHIKSLPEITEFYNEVFKDKYIAKPLFDKAMKNAETLAEECNYEIELGTFYFPLFDKSHLDGKLKTFSSKKLFKYLIDRGLDLRANEFIPYKENVQERIQEEFEVIEQGGFIDYILQIWDVVEFYRKNNVLVGPGRGSAAGSLICYLLGITQVNPLKYDLLFSRFLNVGRIPKSTYYIKNKSGEIILDYNSIYTTEVGEAIKVQDLEINDEILDIRINRKGGSPADIDLDIDPNGRDLIIPYLENIYGENNVCQIGAVKNLKIKAAIKDLASLKGIPAKDVIYTNSLYRFAEGTDSQWERVFQNALENSKIKNFVLKNPSLIHDLKFILNQPKAISVHPAAMILLPQDIDIYSTLPLRKDGHNLISQWDGNEIEKAGYLKMDLLRLSELSKLTRILGLIKDRYNEDIILTHIPLNDSKVFQLFTEGHNSSIFQFNSNALIGFCKQLKPSKFEDLVNTLALIRPGSLQNNFHNTYVKIKEGKAEPEYDPLMEEVLEPTYGLYIFQEQVQRAFEIIGGFDLATSDIIRRCLSPNTYFYVENKGYIKLKNLKQKSKISTYNNSEYKVKFNTVNHIYNRKNKACLEIWTESGSLICSKDHKIYTNYGWVEAQNLTNKHYLLKDRKVKKGGLSVSKEKIYLTAALITEGSLGTKGKCHFTNKDIEEIDNFIKYYEKYTGKKIRNRQDKEDKCIDLYFEDNLVEDLELNFVKSGEKELPLWCLNLCIEDRRYLLSKMIDFDGGVEFTTNKSASISYWSKSKILINQIQLLFNSLGVSGLINQDEEGVYYINISGDYNLGRYLLFNHSKKIRNLKKTKESYRSKIPYNLWNNKILNLIKNSGFYQHELIGNQNKRFKDSNYEITEYTLKKYLKACGRDKELESYLYQDTYWSRFKKSINIGEQEVWDFTMNTGPTPQAFGNGFLVHNSMGKKKMDLIQEYKIQFVQNAVNDQGLTKELATEIFEKLEKFAAYGFNKSHSVCYALISYWGQYLKAHYPTAFYTVALESLKSDKKDEYAKILREIELTSNVKIALPDINDSLGRKFKTDFDINTIYWSLNKIRWVGDAALNLILEDRELNSRYYSFDEFLERLGEQLDQRVVKNLIFAGSFDTIEEIATTIGRRRLLERYIEWYNEDPKYKLTIEKSLKLKSLDILNEEYWWTLKQKSIVELGELNYQDLLASIPTFKNNYANFVDKDKYLVMLNKKFGIIGGILKEIEIKSSKGGEYFRLTINQNNQVCIINIWNTQYVHWKENIDENDIGKIVFMSGLKNVWNGFHSFSSFDKSKLIII